MSDTFGSETGANMAVEARKSAIVKVLKDPTLAALEYRPGTKKPENPEDPPVYPITVLESLDEHLSPAIAKAQEAGDENALVNQPLDLLQNDLDGTWNRDFTRAFLKAFGATAVVNGEEIPLTPENLTEVISNLTPQAAGVDVDLDKTPTVLESDTNNNNLTVKTNIEGVYMILDVYHTGDRVRPMLLVKVN